MGFVNRGMKFKSRMWGTIENQEGIGFEGGWMGSSISSARTLIFQSRTINTHFQYLDEGKASITPIFLNIFAYFIGWFKWSGIT